MALALDEQRAAIADANEKDIAAAKASGMAVAMIDRLTLTPARIDGMIKGIREVAALPDPVGKKIWKRVRPNGLVIEKKRVPLGVVGIIYESRPNVTVDAFCLAYKSGNAILLRGSSSAIESNRALVRTIRRGLQAAGSSGVPGAIALADSTSHEDVNQILTAVGKIDCVVPRGGKKLIQTVVENARVPVIETGSGVCHLYVDDEADLAMAVSIAENSAEASTT